MNKLRKKIFIKPATPGCEIRNPERMGKPLKQEGEWVTKNTDWMRSLKHGDVVELANEPKEKDSMQKKSKQQPVVKSKINEGDL